MGTADASSTSPDHAVSFDPLGAEPDRGGARPGDAPLRQQRGGRRREHHRQAASRTRCPTDLFSGEGGPAGGTVADEKRGAAALQAGRGRSPGTRRLPAARDATTSTSPASRSRRRCARRRRRRVRGTRRTQAGTLANSADREHGRQRRRVASSGEKGFVGVVGSRLRHALRRARGHAHEEEEGARGARRRVRIDLQQRRVDLRGEYTQPFGGRSAPPSCASAWPTTSTRSWRATRSAPRFTNEGWEGRLELLHKPLGPVSRALSACSSCDRDFDAIGAEAFLPPTETRALGGVRLRGGRQGAVKGAARRPLRAPGRGRVRRDPLQPILRRPQRLGRPRLERHAGVRRGADAWPAP